MTLISHAAVVCSFSDKTVGRKESDSDDVVRMRFVHINDVYVMDNLCHGYGYSGEKIGKSKISIFHVEGD